MQRKACISPCSHVCRGSRHSSAANTSFLCPRIPIFWPSRNMALMMKKRYLCSLLPPSLKVHDYHCPSPSHILLGVYVPVDSHCLQPPSKIYISKPKAQSVHLHPKSSCLAHNHLTDPVHLPSRLPWTHTPLHSLISPTPRSFLLR